MHWFTIKITHKVDPLASYHWILRWYNYVRKSGKKEEFPICLKSEQKQRKTEPATSTIEKSGEKELGLYIYKCFYSASGGKSNLSALTKTNAIKSNTIHINIISVVKVILTTPFIMLNYMLATYLNFGMLA